MDEFVKTILRSGLFATAEFEAVRQSAPADALTDPKGLANYLVRTGKLSRFQASKLLEGVTLGLVLGPFHVLAPIGKGGMGAVYLARDSRTQGLVALKVLPPKRAKAQERLLIRFRREMEISQRVVHPHLTRTLEVGVHLGINYIAMEFIPGKNLNKLVREEGPLRVPRAARMFAEVALGLSYAHAQGLIHRDLKPSNLMIMPDDHVKVLDLGLALIQGETETDRTITGGQGYVVGTLDYLAPEQAEDPLKVDARSDIYSLGCTLYYALTGSPPFAGGNALQKMLKHRLDPPRPVCEVNPSVPATFAVLLTRMIAKRAEMRFQSAAELREALLPWTGDVPGTIAPGLAVNPPESVPVALPGNGRSDGPAPVAIPVPASPLTPAAASPPASVPFPAPAAGAPPAQAKPSGATAKLPTLPPPVKPPAGATAKISLPPGLLPAPPPTPAAVPLTAPVAGPGAAAVPVASVAASPPPAPAPAPPQAKAPSAPAPAKPAAPAIPPPAAAPKPPPVPVANTPPRPMPAMPPPAAKPPADATIPMAAEPKTPLPESAPAPASPEAPVKVPMVEEPDAEQLPFWLDFGVPVGSGAFFLFVLWVLTVVLIWQL